MAELPGPGRAADASRSRSACARWPSSASTRASRSAAREPAVDDDAVDAEIEQLRERLAKLETAERAAAEGDYVVMDYAGAVDGEAFDGGTGSDQLIELGSGRLIPGFEEQLVGARAGDERTVEVSFPEDYQAERSGRPEAGDFAVTVKEVKEKILPPVDDDAGLRRRRLRLARRAQGGHRASA